MMTLNEFEQRLNTILIEPETEKYIPLDTLQNGLVTRGREQVKRVGFGVSDSLALYDLAVQQQCDLVVVHHCMPKDPNPALNRYANQRLAFAEQHALSVWSAHYTLDAHSVLGNNAQMLAAIGAQQTERTWFEMDAFGAPWGWIGEFSEPQTIDDIVQRLAGRLSPANIVYEVGPKKIRRVASVSGKGAPTLPMMQLIADAGVELYITGEIHEWNRELAREAGVALLAGGHYHTETFGLQALMPVIEHEGVETVWLDLPNDV